MYIPSENDLRLVMQRNRTWAVKIEVLNERFQVLAEVQGEGLSLSLSVSAESDVRRTCSLDMYVKDDAYQITEASYFWFRRMIRPYYGIYDVTRGDYAYYMLGTFLLNENSYIYDTTSRRLTLAMTDLMAKATSMQGSALGGQSTVVEVNANIRNAIISVLEQMVGITRYRIAHFPSGQTEVPYDLKFSAGSYPYDVLAELRDLYPCREMYFDVDGVFVCGPIPSGKNEPVVLDRTYMDKLLISETRATSFAAVKNVTEIWGAQLNAERTADSCTYTNGIYTLAIPDITVMDDDVTYCFTPPETNAASPTLRVNDLTACPIVLRHELADGTYEDEALEAGVLKAGRPYVVYYSDGVFEYYGELSIHAMAMVMNAEPTAEQKAAYEEKYACHDIRYDVNPLDRFAVERIGIIKQVMIGGEYENIYTTELALERAAYETWRTTRLEDIITLDTILIPWLDVNQLIEYTSPATGEVMQAMIETIDLNVADGTMTLGLVRYYPYYPW